MAGHWSYKPARRVRFPHLVLNCSPIGGREPAFEAGDAGSIPARGTNGTTRERMVAVAVLVCTPRCERGGAGSIPAGHPDQKRRRGALLVGGQPVPKTGVVVSSPRGSIPPLPSQQNGPFGYQLGCRPFKAAKRGQHPHGLPMMMSLSSSRPRTPPSQGGNAGSNPARDATTPPASGSRPGLRIQAQAFESPRGYKFWRRAGAVTDRPAKPRSTNVARVRFAPSPLLLPWTEQIGGELQPRHMPVQVRPGAPFARKVFVAAHLTASQRDRVRIPVRVPFSFAPLSERLGPCLPSKREAFDSPAVLHLSPG